MMKTETQISGANEKENSEIPSDSSSASDMANGFKTVMNPLYPAEETTANMVANILNSYLLPEDIKPDKFVDNENYLIVTEEIKSNVIATILNRLKLPGEKKADMVTPIMTHLDFPDEIKAGITDAILNCLENLKEESAMTNAILNCLKNLDKEADIKDLILNNSDRLEEPQEPKKPVADQQDAILKQEMMTGSIFQGQVDGLNMYGRVRYTMPHGVVFEGVMKDGMFQGDGVLRYPTGAALYGTWDQGRLINTSKYVYRDGLTRPFHISAREDDFHYCDGDDRRFYRETKEGIAPCSDEVCPRLIPGRYYDVGDGYLDLTVNWVLDPDTLEPRRHADAETIARAVNECRTGWHEYTGNEEKEQIAADQINMRKAYKHVPGFDSRKKQYKLERKLNILRYKINHDIATAEDLDMYERLWEWRSGVTLEEELLKGGMIVETVSSDEISETVPLKRLLKETEVEYKSEQSLSSTSLSDLVICGRKYGANTSGEEL